MAGETTGWNGQFWLHNGSTLVRVMGVTEVGLPEITVDTGETTPLNATGKFKQFIATLLDGGEFPVMMNHTPRNADDLLCRAQLSQTRAFKIVEPGFDGTQLQQIDGTVIVTGYKPSPLKPGEPRTAELTLKVTAAPTYS